MQQQQPASTGGGTRRGGRGRGGARSSSSWTRRRTPTSTSAYAAAAAAAAPTLALDASVGTALLEQRRCVWLHPLWWLRRPHNAQRCSQQFKARWPVVESWPSQAADLVRPWVRPAVACAASDDNGARPPTTSDDNGARPPTTSDDNGSPLLVVVWLRLSAALGDSEVARDVLALAYPEAAADEYGPEQPRLPDDSDRWAAWRLWGELAYAPANAGLLLMQPPPEGRPESPLFVPRSTLVHLHMTFYESAAQPLRGTYFNGHQWCHQGVRRRSANPAARDVSSVVATHTLPRVSSNVVSWSRDTLWRLWLTAAVTHRQSVAHRCGRVWRWWQQWRLAQAAAHAAQPDLVLPPPVVRWSAAAATHPQAGDDDGSGDGGLVWCLRLPPQTSTAASDVDTVELVAVSTLLHSLAEWVAHVAYPAPWSRAHTVWLRWVVELTAAQLACGLDVPYAPSIVGSGGGGGGPTADDLVVTWWTRQWHELQEVHRGSTPAARFTLTLTNAVQRADLYARRIWTAGVGRDGRVDEAVQPAADADDPAVAATTNGGGGDHLEFLPPRHRPQPLR